MTGLKLFTMPAVIQTQVSFVLAVELTSLYVLHLRHDTGMTTVLYLVLSSP